MSICQGGSGIPFLAQPVYTCLCTGKCTGISVGHADIPDPVLQFVMQKVHAVPSVCVCMYAFVYVYKLPQYVCFITF